jgi:hypothetical protein
MILHDERLVSSGFKSLMDGSGTCLLRAPSFKWLGAMENTAALRLTGLVCLLFAGKAGRFALYILCPLEGPGTERDATPRIPVTPSAR